MNTPDPHPDFSYKNTDLSSPRRATLLLQQMTWEEKLAQLSGTRFDWGKENFPVEVDAEGKLVKSPEYAELTKEGLGNISHVNFSIGITDSIRYHNAIQRDLIENTRLGIPAFTLEECCHGQLSQEATVFPLPPNMAATFDPKLTHAIFKQIGRETRVRGGNTVASPNLDLARDPRWGRVEETFGEDGYLAGQMGIAAVQGLQGDGDLKHYTGATPKHFAGYGQSIGGRQRATCDIPERYFRDEILVSFRYAVEEGKPCFIMPSYSDVDGIPCHANPWLLKQVLRDEWGFEGVVGADFQGVNMIYSDHGIAETPAEAGEIALRAGVDIDWPKGVCYQQLLEKLPHDRELRDLIDQAVFRALKLKFDMGLFDHPYVDEAIAREIVHNDAARALAQESAEKSLILLKNDGGLLPLTKAAPKRITVVGPHSRYLQFGGVSPHAEGVSIEEGLRAYLEGTDHEIIWAQGCVMTDSEEFVGYLSNVTEEDFLKLGDDAYDGKWEEKKRRKELPKLVPLEKEERAIEIAVERAASSDLVLLCIGESQSICGEGVGSNDPSDRDSLELVGNQLELMRRLKATGTPIIAVLIHGRALNIDAVLEMADAVIDAWNPGEARGIALARLLFGEFSPAGRLPVTLPTTVGQLPVYYSQRRTGWLGPYALRDKCAGLPFGYGLSYTSFDYSNLRLSAETISAAETLTVSIDVTNTGEHDGDEVVQLYLQDEVASVSRPAWQLKAFQRIHLKKGETKTVELQLDHRAFRFHNRDMKEVVEAGRFNLYVGSWFGDKRATARFNVVHD